MTNFMYDTPPLFLFEYFTPVTLFFSISKPAKNFLELETFIPLNVFQLHLKNNFYAKKNEGPEALRLHSSVYRSRLMLQFSP
ncbi:hypothetical protein DTO10_17150 [Peribacillus butanolivorans]|uniref:Uncharacterized protein n=1 Tax=Peribacillus butanolivorans TaxID=421767 RepID=A0ABM6XMY7_9BACI|nr:hypothetical protein DTO10_17150 [Peribacillus butanolivorans]